MNEDCRYSRHTDPFPRYGSLKWDIVNQMDPKFVDPVDLSTKLHHAVNHDFQDIVEDTVKNFPGTIYARNIDGNTPLMFSINISNTYTIKLLTEAKYLVNNENNNALHVEFWEDKWCGKYLRSLLPLYKMKNKKGEFAAHLSLARSSSRKWELIVYYHSKMKLWSDILPLSILTF